MKDSGVEWLGDLPEHWEVTAVKRRYAIRLGKMLQTNPNGPTDIEVPYLKAQHVQWFQVRTADAPRMWASANDSTQFGIARGDLLVCEGGEGGRCGIVKQQVDGYIIQNALHRVRPRRQNRNDYLQYMMSAVAATNWFAALNDKATIAHFTREKFSALRMPIPPVLEQTAIVRFLDHADRRIQRYIRAKQKLVTLLEEQKQALIHRAVTGKVDIRTGLPYPAYKPSGVEWLGEVPKHWKVRKLRQCGSVSGGMTPSMDVRRFWGGLVPWVTPKDMKQAVISDSSVRTTNSAVQETSLRLIEPPAVLIVVRGMILARRVPIACTAAPVTINQDMKALRTVKGMNAAFLARSLDSAQEAFIPLIDEAGHGTRRLPMERWRELVITIPPEEEQAAIVEYLDNTTADIDSVIDHTRHQINLLQEYRTRLIADVVTGKLDVREAAARLPDEVEEPEPLDETDALIDGKEEPIEDLDAATEEATV